MESQLSGKLSILLLKQVLEWLLHGGTKQNSTSVYVPPANDSVLTSCTSSPHWALSNLGPVRCKLWTYGGKVHQQVLLDVIQDVKPNTALRGGLAVVGQRQVADEQRTHGSVRSGPAIAAGGVAHRESGNQDNE